jgi:hypothetical protein
MKTFTFSEFKDWILGQPDDAPINMRNSINTPENCGCLLIQFGRTKGLSFHGCGFNILNDSNHRTVAEIGGENDCECVSLISRALKHEVKTFKEVKRLL